jgi:hypothetical protein
MPEILLTIDQARTLTESQDNVLIRNPDGTVVAEIDPGVLRVLARRRSQSQQATSTLSNGQVRFHLQDLAKEWERTGGFDANYLKTYLEQLRQKDTV